MPKKPNRRPLYSERILCAEIAEKKQRIRELNHRIGVASGKPTAAQTVLEVLRMYGQPMNTVELRPFAPNTYEGAHPDAYVQRCVGILVDDGHVRRHGTRPLTWSALPVADDVCDGSRAEMVGARAFLRECLREHFRDLSWYRDPAVLGDEVLRVMESVGKPLTVRQIFKRVETRVHPYPCSLRSVRSILDTRMTSDGVGRDGGRPARWFLMPGYGGARKPI